MLWAQPGPRPTPTTELVASLETALRMMAEHQLDRSLSDEEVEDIVAFLGALTGALPSSVSTPRR